MNNSNYNFKTEIYLSHIGKQLFEHIYSEVDFGIFLGKLFHSERNFYFKDIIHEDDIYIQTLSTLVNEKLNYYLKNLEIIVDKENYKVINVKYDYYDKYETILGTNIQIL